MKIRLNDHIENLFLDNNILSRILKKGYDASLAQISAELKKHSLRNIQERKTITICTASNAFEYCGFKKDEFVTPDELKKISEMEDTSDSNAYFGKVYEAIRTRVEQSLTSGIVLAKLEQKLQYLPKDSQAFLDRTFIKPLKVDPDKIKEITQDATFHLFFGCPVIPKYSDDHHLQAVRMAFQYFKSGHIVSIGKLLPAIWRKMRNSEAGDVFPPKEKDTIDGLVGLHDVGDFLDSDLIHLAVAGIFKTDIQLSRPVYCLTEDLPLKLKQRVMLYKSLLRTILVRGRSGDKRPGHREYKDIDLKFGRVVSLNSNFEIVESFSAQTLKRVFLP